MKTTQFRLLNEEELEGIFYTHMVRDFPENELKPLSRIQALIQQGKYLPYGLFEGDTLLAYAMFWQTEGARYKMLDYFAVVPERRNGGTGSALLADMMARFCVDGRGIYGEVEIPETGDEAVDNLRQRRIDFYLRAGMRLMGFRTKIYGVPYVLVAYGADISDADLMEINRKIYRDAFPPEIYQKEVFIPWTEK